MSSLPSSRQPDRRSADPRSAAPRPAEWRPSWHSDYRGNDLDEARDFYARGYNGSGFRAERSQVPFSYRYASTAPGPVSLHSASFLGSVRGAVEPGGVYVVLWLTQGRASLDLGREENRLMIGRPAVFPTGRPFGFDAQEYRDALVHIEAAHLEGIAAEMHGTAPGPLRFASAPGDTAPWWAAVRVLRDTLASAVPPSALQRDAAHRLAAEAMLRTFAHRVARCRRPRRR
ncbi:hypothetical protein Q0F99_09395 [Rathayibacter oskolensis]|uniref:AraC-like ligand-binding domain-containing protein n=1 Tax=Rathayibacter oskolensis TaxID=1891671 RepID=UPI00265F3CCE|nr:hypothetical protein [Rathayibacter oskolensis]WKK73037.1 hypothetical protein Q0F99_09395 [Rathayibacter oskolensis]